MQENNCSLKAPVLFLVFNRLDTTKQVFEAIRKAKPPRLYVAADGPREQKAGEADKVEAVRNFVMSNIDWPCDVKTLFRDKNLGCKYAVSSAITWFFENEEMGIIIEDDCVVSQSYFWYCQDLLDRYKNDMRVWHIGGNNFQDGIKRGEGDYYFSIYSHIWGWASWANRWHRYDAELKSHKNAKFLKGVLNKRRARRYWRIIFYLMKYNIIDTWDYQWLFTMWQNNGLAISPAVNMVKNIGFGADATHTTSGSHHLELKACELSITSHPATIEIDAGADEYTCLRHFSPEPLFVRIFRKLKKIIILALKKKPVF